MSRVLSRLATEGADIERRLVIYWEDLRRGISEVDARGVKQFEVEAWQDAAQNEVRRLCPVGSPGRDEWEGVTRDFLVDKYYAGCDLIGKVGKIVYYYRRRLKVVCQLSFEFPHEAEVRNVSEYNIHIENNSGLVAVMSKLDNVSQTLASGALDQAKRAELLKLIADLRSALGGVPPESADDAELVAEQAEKIGLEMARAKPRANALKITAHGLIEAAKALADVVPNAIEVAKKIAVFVTSPMA